MVEFVPKPAIEGDLTEPSKLKDSIDPLDPPEHFDPESIDTSFSDSFFDFDCIKEWFLDNPTAMATNPESIDIGTIDSDVFDGSGGMVIAEEPVGVNGSELIFDGSGGKVIADNPVGANGSELIVDGSVGKVIAENPVGVNGSELVVDGSGAELKVKVEESENLGDCKNLSLSIEKVLESVSLAEESVCCKVGDGKEVKNEIVSDDDDDKEESERVTGSSSSLESSSESSSESEASSGCDESDSDEEEEEEKKVKKVVLNVENEVEEGEIVMEAGEWQMVNVDDEEEDDVVDGMVAWSDADEDEDDDVGSGAAKPIRSKNELEDLPPVPPVDVALQPNHQMLPVGVVLSIMGAKVIVEGVEKHNPLSEGSILWITEKRSPLGLIDEIFGPVKNPYYVVRYNSESEVPAGLQGGSLISFVPDFANHVLNDPNLYKKGYDASGDNDEEVSDEAEFSDDEQEAEYKRMQKMAKRGSNSQNLGNGKNNRKKGRNRDGPWKNQQPNTSASPLPPGQNQHHTRPWKNQQPNTGASPLPPGQNQHHMQPVASSHDGGNCSETGQFLNGGTGMTPSFPQNAQAGGFGSNNVMPYQQPQGMVFPNGFPAEGLMPWMLNPFQNPYPMPMAGTMQFQQQFDHIQRALSCAALSTGQPNMFPGSSATPWLGFMGQNSFNQANFGVNLQGQQLPSPTNTGGQVMLPNAMNMEQNNSCSEAPRQFNQGASSARGRGRKQYHRGGGGRFAGGRGKGRQEHK